MPHDEVRDSLEAISVRVRSSGEPSGFDLAVFDDAPSRLCDGSRTKTVAIWSVEIAESGSVTGGRQRCRILRREIKMAKGKQTTINPSTVDVSEARSAFEVSRSAIDALPRDQLLAIRIDVQAAAAVAYSIALRDATPERRAEFEKLSNAALFDTASLDTLKQLALATWHARQQQQLSTGTASGATVPAPVLVEAQDVRGRMLRVWNTTSKRTCW